MIVEASLDAAVTVMDVRTVERRVWGELGLEAVEHRLEPDRVLAQSFLGRLQG